MKKYIALSAVAMSFVAAASLNGADDLSGMFSGGKASGQIREFSISRTMDYSNPALNDYTRNANAIGGYLKYETADFKGLSFGAAFYTTNGFFNDSPKTDYTEVDPTLLGENNDNYSMLGEAYIQYKMANTTFKAGRQRLDTPMLGSDDARMVPNLFEAYVLTNKDIANTTLMAAHVTKFAQGTFGRAYGAGGILGSTAGYSSWDASNQVGEFKNMGTYAANESTDGVSILSATHTFNKNLKVQLWDYYAHDIMNTIYGQVDASWNCLVTDAIKPSLSIQMIKENDIGDELLGKIDSTYWAAKFDAKIQNFTASLAYSQTSKNSATDAARENAITSTWGGMPAFTQGMVTRHMFLAGTDAAKVALSYNFKDLGANVLATLYYADFDMAENNGYTFDDASESGFDIIYKPAIVKNLELRLRANYAEDFNVNAAGATTGWDEYRFIANYNF
ncbi:MAG: OprD family outer membrane porin [Sulfurimonas sp.]|uniref:OprD family outer membrane porin n=1 Tax=Sulfurimonas sp. TaxID=2022749 RepID=UPI002618FE50|nr:OprD family outer membrane porin [Sulfurimonas sp.]MDD2652855.1 OprD family outer membrane porin [Sulfurimonas sp.]MDD3450900.1 OprD family outer membrane porin [Sulfurimonas sp.]